MESVLVGKETSSGMGEMLKFRRNESVALYGDSSLLFELHRVKYHKPKSYFYLPALPPNTSVPDKEPRRFCHSFGSCIFIFSIFLLILQ